MELLPNYDYWNNLAANIALGCWALGLIITLLYVARLSFMSDNKASYDFINKNEIKVLWIASIIMVVGPASMPIPTLRCWIRFGLRLEYL